MIEEDIEELIIELRELQVRQAVVTAEIQRLHQRRIGSEPDLQTTTLNGFRVGDRIVITNRVRKPAAADASWTEAKERLATVTRIRPPDQVHITTDNGTKTWRSPNNIRKRT